MLSAISAPDSAAFLAAIAGGLPKDSPMTLLLGELAASNYSFITPTPLTHQRLMTRRQNQYATTLRDIFGWNQQFQATALTPELLALMAAAGILQPRGEGFSSSVRVSSIGDDLFVHSAYPTTQDDAVFFGPDTYRFARFIQQGIHPGLGCPPFDGHGRDGWSLRVLDVGCGSGAGGVIAARRLGQFGLPVAVTMNDINPLALHYTAVNAAFAGIAVELAHGDALSAVTGNFDLVISNPPYMDDAAARAYRHGGAQLGRALSVRIATEALARLAPGGQLLLYTGVAIVDGVDRFIAELLPFLQQAGCEWSYSEIDPDVFGEELDQPVYAQAERIAAVGLMARRKLRPA